MNDKVAVIEDDRPTSNQLAGWIRAARPELQIDQWFDRDSAEAALQRERYALVVLDIELGRERHAGVAIINAINKLQQGTPVLVVSAMPAAIYRSIMKALDAWDYLQKTAFDEAEFIETFLDILRSARAAQPLAVASAPDELKLDPLWQRSPTWRGQRINLPLTAQRILATLVQRKGQVVSYDDLFEVVKSGRNRDNVRKHVSTIREAFRDVDPVFDGIENVPMRGFRWTGMKFSLPDLPALTMPRLPLAAFRRRLVVRGVFLLLMLATLALAVTLLAEEKQRSRQRYEAGFRQTLEGLAAQLRHPSGQLALLNAGAALGEHLAPLVLPFSALDFDDPFKARQAVEMSGCALRWANGTQLCAAVGGSAYAGGFLYLVGSLALPPAQARERGALDLQEVHRARVSIALRGAEERWVAPFEAPGDAPVQNASGGQRGRLTGFASASANDQLDARAKPDRDFRGWLWQDAECAERDAVLPDCARRTLLSIRVPVQAWRDALFQRPAPPWPPADLSQVQVRLQWLAAGGAPLFDSTAPGAERPFALPDLAKKLAPGETLRIQRIGSTSALPILRGIEQQAEPSSPWLTRLILRLPAERDAERIQAEDEVQTAGGRYQLTLTGDLKSVDRGLSATATRLSGFVGAMLAAILLAWAVIEIGLMRRMAQLTKRAAGLSYNMQDPQLERRLGELDVADLRGKDELGILAGSLAELLGRVKEGVRREHIRAEQERDMWHAVGHEIMSPLQSLMVLHGGADDPSRRYVQRMQQAVRVLYGSASPSEAIAAAALEVGTLDLEAFVREVAANATFAGIAGVRCESLGAPLMVRADAYSLEDVVTHVLRNADRHRVAGTPITLRLRRDAEMAELDIHNEGPPIDETLRERIFEYGVSDQEPGGSGERRGQGLFVARTYMAKMGGTIEARNVEGGVSFLMRLPGA